MEQSDLTPAVVQSTVIEVMPIPVDVMKRQIQAIQTCIKEVMQEDVHYGTIPGTDKPTLLKPGAEKICAMFRLFPHYDMQTIERAGGHREIRVTCSLKTADGAVIAQGVGVCSTLESKYRWRDGEGVSTGKEVPQAYWDGGKDKALIGGKQFTTIKGEDGKWYIATRGAKVENPDIADTYNTVAKMASKRALVHATIGATAAGDCFNQDLEDLDPRDIRQSAPRPVAKAATNTQQAAAPQAEAGSAPQPRSNAEYVDTGVIVPKEYWANKDQSLIGGKGHTTRKVGKVWHIFRRADMSAAQPQIDAEDPGISDSQVEGVSFDNDDIPF